MSEYLKILATPILCVLFLLALGIFFMRKAKKSHGPAVVGWNLTVLAFLVLGLLSFKPVSNLLVSTLESRYPPVTQAEIEKADIIIILAGGILPGSSYQKTADATGATYSRLFNGVEIFKKSRAKKLIVAGLGYGNEGVSEASVMKRMAIALGVPSEAVIAEERSHTTLESMSELRKRGLIEKESTVGLVTSAIHMMRSVWTIKKAFPDIRVIPMPCGYLSGRYGARFPVFIPSVSNFDHCTAVAHEWLGIVWYKLQLGK